MDEQESISQLSHAARATAGKLKRGFSLAGEQVVV